MLTGMLQVNKMKIGEELVHKTIKHDTVSNM